MAADKGLLHPGLRQACNDPGPSCRPGVRITPPQRLIHIEAHTTGLFLRTAA
jgi:hypothetical protein